jgi:hypothetical protein
LQTRKLPLQPPLRALKRPRCSRALHYDRMGGVTVCFCRVTAARFSKTTGVCKSAPKPLSSHHLSTRAPTAAAGIRSTWPRPQKSPRSFGNVGVFWRGSEQRVHSKCSRVSRRRAALSRASSRNVLSECNNVIRTHVLSSLISFTAPALIAHAPLYTACSFLSAVLTNAAASAILA